MRTTLTKRAADFHIDLDDVAITDLKFGKDFTAAIESKQVAEQDAERAKFMVLKAEQEKQAQLLRAEGLVAAEETPPLLLAVPRRPPSSRRRASPRRLASSRRRWRTRPPSSSCAASRCTSPHTSPYLPISPHISPYLTVRYVQGVNDVATPFFLVLLADGLPRGSAHTAEDVDEVHRNLLRTF